MFKYFLQVHTEENKRYAMFKISPSKLIHFFLCWNAMNFHQDVYTSLTILNVILVFSWVGEETACKALPRLQMMYTPRRHTKPLPRRSLLYDTCLHVILLRRVRPGLTKRSL